MWSGWVVLEKIMLCSKWGYTFLPIISLSLVGGRHFMWHPHKIKHKIFGEVLALIITSWEEQIATRSERHTGKTAVDGYKPIKYTIRVVGGKFGRPPEAVQLLYVRANGLEWGLATEEQVRWMWLTDFCRWANKEIHLHEMPFQQW